MFIYGRLFYRYVFRVFWLVERFCINRCNLYLFIKLSISSRFFFIVYEFCSYGFLVRFIVFNMDFFLWSGFLI